MAALKRFEDAPQLKQFTLKDVTPTGKQLGVGSFGSVEELRVAGAVCAGKKIHATLLDSGNQGWLKMVDRFTTECDLMSEIRHPNLVQFLGLYFYEDSAGPVLVMERLERSLHNFMEKYKSRSIPLILKTQILFDVAKGLVYLHTHSPAVVHRDLTARNVLLSSSMQAKIADLGNARIINPGRLSSTLSQTPGTTVYMPPEATGTNPQYDAKLDMFSFGHLSLYVVAQEFPENLLPSTYTDPDTEKLLPRSEIERRQPVIDKLTVDKKHALSGIITQCLSNIALKRPDANTVMKQLEGLVDSDSDHKGMSRLDILHMMDGKRSLSRSRVDQIRGGQPGALQIQRTSMFGKASWKSYVFEINNSTHLKYSGGKQAVKAIIPLRDIQMVVPCPQLSEQGRFAFEVKIYGKPTRILGAYSEEERASWMEAIFIPIPEEGGASPSDDNAEASTEGFMADDSGLSSQLSDEELYERMQSQEEFADQEDPNTDLYDDLDEEMLANQPATYEDVAALLKPLPPIPTDENVAYDTSSTPARERNATRAKLPLPPTGPPVQDSTEEGEYYYVSKNMSIKRPPPGDPQQKAKVYVDPSQLDMLMKMMQSAQVSDPSEETGTSHELRPRSVTHPPSIPTTPSVNIPVEGEPKSDDGIMLYEDMGGIELYDDTLVSPSKKDVYENILDDEWTAQLQRAVDTSKKAVPNKKPMVPPKPKRSPQPPKRGHMNLHDSDEATPPVVPPRVQSKLHPPAPSTASPRHNTVATEEMYRMRGRPRKSTASPRHGTAATEEMYRMRGRPRKSTAATEDDKIKSLAMQAEKLKSDRFLRDDESDEEDEYEARPLWTKARTSTLSPSYNSLAALHRESLFIQRSALQNMAETGKGQFGVVYRASLVRSNGSRCRVAVKTIKRYQSEKETDEFLKEMTIMSKLVHPNIVRLYGLVEQESPWIVLELLPLGDLKTFLTKHKRPVDTLIKYMLDVAMGMHYIAEKGLIHRDLAARNILVGENEQCKVSDFGLLRELPPGDEIYVSHDKNSKWPVRWLAPESLRLRQFSSASDTWSFGILQWEMYFPTKLPYAELGDNMQCALAVCDGHRLSVPSDYPPKIARIMKACWNKKPINRPSFLLISALLTNMTFGIE